MIRFRRDGLRALEISGTDVELGLLAEDLKDIIEGLGEWVAVTGDVARGRLESTGLVGTVIFRTIEGAGSLVPAADLMVECRLSPPVLQRLLDEVRMLSGAMGTNEGPVSLRDHELEIRVICTGEEAA